MADYPAKHEFVDDYPYLAYASEVDTVAGSGEGGEGGGSYTLPVASVDTLGGVKIGSGLAIDSDGVLSSSGGVLIVNDTEDVSTHTNSLDKKFSEILSAFQNGIVIIKAVQTLGGDTTDFYTLVIGVNDNGNGGKLFTSDDVYNANSYNDYPIMSQQ